MSARAIPGNEKAIGRVMNHIARRGADVIYEGIKHVHVSGHGSEEELKLMLSLVRPRYFVPDARRIPAAVAARADRRARVRRARAEAARFFVTENGDLLQFDADGRPHRRQGAGRAAS